LALTLDIELFTQVHYRESIDRDSGLSELFKDVFLYHWREESQHAILDELEWLRHDAEISAEQRDRAVNEFIELVAAVDGILQAQAKADAGYFTNKCGRPVDAAEAQAIHPFGGPAPALRRGAIRPDHREAGSAHSERARYAPLITSTASTTIHRRYRHADQN
jgi:hypothetical protein